MPENPGMNRNRPARLPATRYWHRLQREVPLWLSHLIIKCQSRKTGKVWYKKRTTELNSPSVANEYLSLSFLLP
uniref:Alternative protein TET2 n=1 Tax=Homo sapiens TaxID=9606 RepID=L8E8T1_HUMAN|nr:alternative protein TET2 [Homo sapiens]